MKRNLFQRVTTIILICGMVMSVMPFSAFAGDSSRWGEDEGYGYTCLTTEGQRSIYRQLEDAVEDMAASFKAEGIVSVEELTAANLMLISDHPEYFWYLGQLQYTYNSKGVSTVYLAYQLDGALVTEAEAAEEELEDIVEEIIDGIPEGASEYDTALYLHDVLTERVDYVAGVNNQTAYGALVDDGAVAYADEDLFIDVTADDWYAGYAHYCAEYNLGPTSGYFNGLDPLTVPEAAKMIMCAMGYSAEACGFIGDNWVHNVLIAAEAEGLLNGFNYPTYTYIPRQWLAVMLCNAIDNA